MKIALAKKIRRRKNMPGPRKRYSADLKAKIALEAIRGQRKVNEIASEYGVHPTQISQWKRQALDGLPDIFISHTNSQTKTEETLIVSLFQQVDQLKVLVNHLAEKVRSAH